MFWPVESAVNDSIVLSIVRHTDRLHRIQEYERQVAVQRLQDDDARTTALADFKAKMLEERKAFRRQNDMERHRVIQSMEKMRKNPAKAVKGVCRDFPVWCHLYALAEA